MTECLSLGLGGVVRILNISNIIAIPIPSSAAPGEGRVESKCALMSRACSYRNGQEKKKEKRKELLRFKEEKKTSTFQKERSKR